MNITIHRRGRLVLCLWAAAVGAVLAPFLFWQSLAAGLVFVLLWAAAVWAVWARACSFVAVAAPDALTVYAGIAFCTKRVVPLGSVASAAQFETPLLRALHCGFVAVFTPGLTVFLPCLETEDAARLCALLCGGRDAEGKLSGGAQQAAHAAPDTKKDASTEKRA